MIGSSLDDCTSFAAGTELSDLLSQSGFPVAVINKVWISPAPSLDTFQYLQLQQQIISLFLNCATRLVFSVWCWADPSHSHSRELQVAAKFILLREKPHLIITALHSLLKMNRQITLVINQSHCRSTRTSANKEETSTGFPGRFRNVGFGGKLCYLPTEILKRPESTSVPEDTVSPDGICTCSSHLGPRDTRPSSKGWGERRMRGPRLPMRLLRAELASCETALLRGFGEQDLRKQVPLLFKLLWARIYVIWSGKQTSWYTGQSWGATETVAMNFLVSFAPSLKIQWY